MEIDKTHLAYIELMNRNMVDHLQEAIHDYVSIHKIEHHDIGVVAIPFVVDGVLEADGVQHASAHTLLVSTTNRENAVNIIQAMTDKLKSGAPIHNFSRSKTTDA